jgi:hypothetical protein
MSFRAGAEAGAAWAPAAPSESAEIAAARRSFVFMALLTDG